MLMRRIFRSTTASGGPWEMGMWELALTPTQRIATLRETRRRTPVSLVVCLAITLIISLLFE